VLKALHLDAAVAKKAKLVELAKAHLHADEKIHAAIEGAYETEFMGHDTVRKGVLIATSHRIVFFAKKLMGYDFESFPYGKISSLEQSKGMMGGKLKFFASGNKVSLKWITDKDFPGFVKGLQGRLSAPPQQPSTPTDAVDPAEQLAKLAKLRDSGVVTDTEFEAKKREILRRM
jgi:hypothetical protein